jgi:hypothetical protein
METKRLKAKVVSNGKRAYTVVEVPTSGNPNKFYHVDVTNKRCSCPGWTLHGSRKPCKHLRSLGITA